MIPSSLNPPCNIAAVLNGPRSHPAPACPLGRRRFGCGSPRHSRLGLRLGELAYPATPKLRRIDSLAAADSHVGNIARWLEGSATNPADRATLLLSPTTSRRAAGGRDILWRHAAGRAGMVRGVFRRGESEAERLSGAGLAGAGDRVRQRISLPPAALEEMTRDQWQDSTR